MGQALKKLESKPLLKLDIGCGPNKGEGFLGVDIHAFKGVDVVHDIRKTPWPWKDSSVEEVRCNQFLEHLTAQERVRFMNELGRILIPGGKATVVTPHWASMRAYGDPTHVWPPVSEMFYMYVLREWRLTQAPHTDISNNKDGFTCDLHATWGYGMNPGIVARSEDYKQFAMANYKESILDIHATLTNQKKQ